MFNFFPTTENKFRSSNYELLGSGSSADSESESKPNTVSTTSNPLISLTKTMSVKEINEIYSQLSLEIKNCKSDPEKLKAVTKKYSDDILFGIIERQSSEPHIRSNLCHILPRDPKHLIFTLVKATTPVDIIEQVADKININYLGDNGDTCLWRVNDIYYLINLLSSKKLNFDINHVNKSNRTMLENIFSKKYSMTTNQLQKLIDIVTEKKYDFKKIHSDISLLDIICLVNTTDINIIRTVACIKEYDVASTTLWLYTLIHSYSIDNVRYIVSAIVHCRSDYESFLNKIMSTYAWSYATADADMLLLMTLIRSLNNKKLTEKLTEIIMYQNDMGNTVAHIASTYHLDRLLRFIMTYPDTKFVFDKNKDGKTPKDLYLENSILNIL